MRVRESLQKMLKGEQELEEGLRGYVPGRRKGWRTSGLKQLFQMPQGNSVCSMISQRPSNACPRSQNINVKATDATERFLRGMSRYTLATAVVGYYQSEAYGRKSC